MFTYIESIERILNRYGVFGGCAQGSEFCWACLFTLVIAIPFSVVSIIHPFYGAVGQGVLSMALFVPGLAVTTRRLHDSGHSAWCLAAWMALGAPGAAALALLTAGPDPDATIAVAAALVCLAWVGYSLIMLLWLLMPGTRGANRYGLPSDPAVHLSVGVD